MAEQHLVVVPLQAFTQARTPHSVHNFKNSFIWLKLPQAWSQRSKDLALVIAEHPSPGLLPGLFNSRPHRILEHLLHTSIAQRWTLQVAFSMDFLSHLSPLCRWNTAATMCPDLPLISLGGYNQHRHLGQVFTNLMDPLVLNAGQRVWVGHREANKDYVGLLVGSRSDRSKVVVSCRVPQTQADLNPVHVHLHPCVLKHGGLVGIWEGLWCEADQQGCLSHSAVPDQDALYRHLCNPVHGSVW